MMLFRNRRAVEGSEDHIPEEEDALVDVLRQAYASTPVPDDLLWKVGAAVRSAHVEPKGDPSRVFPWRRASFVFAPAFMVVLVLAGITIGRGFGSGQPAATALPRPIWGNQSGVSLQADAAFVSKSTIRVRYRIARADDGAPIYGREEGNYNASQAGLLPMHAYLARIRAFVDGRRLAPTSCASASERSAAAGGINVLCYRDRRFSMARTEAKYSAAQSASTTQVLLVAGSVADSDRQGAVPGAHAPSGTKSLKGGGLPLKLDVAGRPVRVPPTCRASSRNFCWLIELPITEPAPSAKPSHRSTR